MIFGSPTGITPYFFIGKVVDKNDPTNNGRVRVRVFGIHPDDPHIPDGDKELLDGVEDADFPWAHCISGTYGKMEAVPDEDDWVIGFFADGRDAQHPILFGTLPGENNDTGGAAAGGAAVGGGNVGQQASNGQATNQQNNNASQTNNNQGRGYDQTSAAGLDEDAEFQAAFEEVRARHPGLTRDELYRTIQGESAFNPTAVNSNSQATGLFQFTPGAASDLGLTVGEIRNMSPAQQMSTYGRYLDRWDYQGGSLGIMQAAPAFANRPGGTEVYGVGTAAWNQNPGWRGSDGRITVNSINAYYDNQRL